MDSSNIVRKVRLATENDIPHIVIIEKQLYPDPWSENTFRSCLNDTTDFFVAEENGAVCGFAVLDRSLGIEAELHNIAVAPDHQGKGLSKLLMDAIINSVKKHGADKIMLEVRASNTPAISLYTKYGFEKVGLRPGYYKHPTETAILMDLNLELDLTNTDSPIGESGTENA